MIDGTAARFWMLSSITRFHQLVRVRVLLEEDRRADADRDDEEDHAGRSARASPMIAA